MAILSFLESTLSAFRHCFNRTPAYRWFVVVICALMVRTDHLGVTSIIRALSLSGKRYESLIHFFRSKAYSLSELRKVWYSVVLKSGALYQLNSRNLLIGDGTKEAKEGRYMPAVNPSFRFPSMLSNRPVSSSSPAPAQHPESLPPPPDAPVQSRTAAWPCSVPPRRW